jgi:hypothetical protein
MPRLLPPYVVATAALYHARKRPSSSLSPSTVDRLPLVWLRGASSSVGYPRWRLERRNGTSTCKLLPASTAQTVPPALGAPGIRLYACMTLPWEKADSAWMVSGCLQRGTEGASGVRGDTSCAGSKKKVLDRLSVTSEAKVRAGTTTATPVERPAEHGQQRISTMRLAVTGQRCTGARGTRSAAVGQQTKGWTRAEPQGRHQTGFEPHGPARGQDGR